MTVDISDIVKVNGASLNIEFTEVLENLVEIEKSVVFTTPVNFSGQLVNINGILKLNGQLKVDYIDKCFRCLKEVESSIKVKVDEDFVSAEKAADIEDLTYQGRSLIIDKVLIDNIVLNLPMKQLCRKSCKGLCTKCGCDLNEKSCDCTDQELNPKLEALKNFFENN